jgi:putative tryptophan/tyrosine transport system substrate-binding protein
LVQRRDFITLLGAAVVIPPLLAHAQSASGMRRVGVFMNLAEDDSEGVARLAAFREALQALGWAEKRNIHIDDRWGAGDADLYRRFAAELVALAPDVILAGGGQVVAPLQQATRTIPIVFTNTNDPLALGFVSSLAHPGGNTTGFINIEYSFSAKWLELLTQVAPRTMHATVLWDSAVASGKAQLDAIRVAASARQIDVNPVDLRNPGLIEGAIATFARRESGGLIVTASTLATLHRDLIVNLANQLKLPSVYPNRLYVLAGGLLSYGPHFIDQYRRAAGYVDRILRGSKPADLPVQAPVRYEMTLNLRTAKAIDLDVPRIVLAAASDVIDD